jgi:hypothetical protein
MTKGLLLIISSVLLCVWWWRKSYVPSPLDQHFSELQAKAQVGTMAQLAAYASPPPVAMVGEGWGTTTRLNATALAPGTQNRPGKLRLNWRFLTPTQ